MLIVTVKGWSILLVLELYYFKLSWIYTIQIMIESRIAQWQNIMYIAEAGIKIRIRLQRRSVCDNVCQF